MSYKYVDLGKVSVGESDNTGNPTVGKTFKVRSHDIMGGVIIHL